VAQYTERALLLRNFCDEISDDYLENNLAHYK